MMKMHQWYFDKGIFMSTSSRDKYFNLKNVIIGVLDEQGIDLLLYIEKDSEYLRYDDVKKKLDKILIP
jgi:hypothetical protein